MLRHVWFCCVIGHDHKRQLSETTDQKEREKDCHAIVARARSDACNRRSCVCAGYFYSVRVVYELLFDRVHRARV